MSILLGETTVDVTDDEFGNGFQTGYLRFFQDFRGKPLTDKRIYEFLMKNTLDILHMPYNNAGYITGWMAALFDIHFTDVSRAQAKVDQELAPEPAPQASNP